MRFGLYTEIQLHPGKTPERMYRRGARADRERRPARIRRLRRNRALLLSEVLDLREPDRALRRRSPAHEADPVSDDAPRAPVPQPAGAGLRDRRHRHPDRRAVRVRRGARSRLDPREGRRPARTSTRGRATRRPSTCCSKPSANERFSHDGEYFHVADSHIVPFPSREFRVTLGGTSDRTYELAAEHGWSVAVPPLLPYVALEKQLDLYREKCAEHGTTPDIVWIHACHLDEDRDTALREARDWTVGFIQGNCSPLTEYEKPSTEGLLKADYGFYTAGIMEQLAEVPVRAAHRGGLHLGRHAGRHHRANRADARDLPRASRRSAITVNAGGIDHWMAIKNQELFASASPRTSAPRSDTRWRRAWNGSASSARASSGASSRVIWPASARSRCSRDAANTRMR